MVARPCASLLGMAPHDAPLATFRATATAWLDANAARRDPHLRWGEGSDDVAVFGSVGQDEAQAVGEALDWQRRKADAGYGSISWAVELGGAGLDPTFEAAFRRLERGYATPSHEAVGISLDIEAPTIRALGSPAQKARWLPPLRRGDALCCQLFSEPGAGSDLASLATTAAREGDGWRIDGQKVWSTGARFADLGYLIARTSPGAPRQQAYTAFVVEMDRPGIDVRPLRQMTGGSSFNEVFLTDVRVPDEHRLGDVGDGWRAAMTTLGFERVAGAGSVGGGTSRLFDRLVLTRAAVRPVDRSRSCDRRWPRPTRTSRSGR